LCLRLRRDFNPDSPEGASGLGLLVMKQQLSLVEGQLSVGSAPSQETKSVSVFRVTRSIHSLGMNRAEVSSVAKTILLAVEPTNSHILDISCNSPSSGQTKNRRRAKPCS
jgi:hypothetical protein